MKDPLSIGSVCEFGIHLPVRSRPSLGLSNQLCLDGISTKLLNIHMQSRHPELDLVIRTLQGTGPHPFAQNCSSSSGAPRSNGRGTSDQSAGTGSQSSKSICGQACVVKQKRV